MSEYQEKITVFVQPAVHLMLQGAVAALRPLPPEEIILATCAALARSIGSSYVGSDDDVRKFRERCRVEFSAALHQAKVSPMPTPPQQQTAEKEKDDAPADRSAVAPKNDAAAAA